MSKFIHIVLIFFALAILAALDIGASYLLPYPFSKISIIFMVLIPLMLWWNSGLIIWLAFFLYLFIELFAVSPFGVILFSGTISVLLGFWLYKNVFASRSWYAVVALTAFILAVYSVLYLFLLSLLYLFSVVEYVPWKLIIVNFCWEFLFTTLAVAVIYFLFSRFSHRFKASVIESHMFRYDKQQ